MFERRVSMTKDFHKLANEEYHQGKFQQALEHIDIAIEKSNKPESYYLRGVIYETLGDNEKAYLDYKRAKELDSTDVCYWENLAKVSKELEKYNESISNYLGTIKFHLENEDTAALATCYYELGSIYDVLKNYEEAKKYYDFAIDLDTKDALNYKLNNVDLIHSEEFKGRLSKLLDSSVFYDVNSSKIFLEDEHQTNNNFNNSNNNKQNLKENAEVSDFNNNELIKKLESELAKKPMDSELNHQMGKALKEAHRYAEAIKYFERSFEKQKKNKMIIIKLADCYWKTKNYEKAIQYCDLFIQLDDKLFKAYKIKSICYFELNRFEKALDNINIAIQLQPDNYTSKQFKKKIQYQLNLQKIDESLDYSNIIPSVIPEHNVLYSSIESFGNEKPAKSAEKEDLKPSVEEKLIEKEEKSEPKLISIEAKAELESSEKAEAYEKAVCNQPSESKKAENVIENAIVKEEPIMMSSLREVEVEVSFKPEERIQSRVSETPEEAKNLGSSSTHNFSKIELTESICFGEEKMSGKSNENISEILKNKEEDEPMTKSRVQISPNDEDDELIIKSNSEEKPFKENTLNKIKEDTVTVDTEEQVKIEPSPEKLIIQEKEIVEVESNEEVKIPEREAIEVESKQEAKIPEKGAVEVKSKQEAKIHEKEAVEVESMEEVKIPEKEVVEVKCDETEATGKEVNLEVSDKEEKVVTEINEQQQQIKLDKEEEKKAKTYNFYKRFSFFLMLSTGFYFSYYLLRNHPYLAKAFEKFNYFRFRKSYQKY